MSNDPKQEQLRKAWTFMSVLAGMGALAKQLTGWRPQPFVGAPVAKPYKPRWQNGRLKPPAAGRPEHVAAVALMREARRLKRMARAETELSEKRRRQAAQLRRHAHCLARRQNAPSLSPPHAVVPAPHFLARSR
jgi:hypothetical protein